MFIVRFFICFCIDGRVRVSVVLMVWMFGVQWSFVVIIVSCVGLWWVSRFFRVVSVSLVFGILESRLLKLIGSSSNGLNFFVIVSQSSSRLISSIIVWLVLRCISFMFWIRVFRFFIFVFCFYVRVIRVLLIVIVLLVFIVILCMVLVCVVWILVFIFMVFRISSILFVVIVWFLLVSIFQIVFVSGVVIGVLVLVGVVVVGVEVGVGVGVGVVVVSWLMLLLLLILIIKVLFFIFMVQMLEVVGFFVFVIGCVVFVCGIGLKVVGLWWFLRNFRLGCGNSVMVSMLLMVFLVSVMFFFCVWCFIFVFSCVSFGFSRLVGWQVIGLVLLSICVCRVVFIGVGVWLYLFFRILVVFFVMVLQCLLFSMLSIVWVLIICEVGVISGMKLRFLCMWGIFVSILFRWWVVFCCFSWFLRLVSILFGIWVMRIWLLVFFSWFLKVWYFLCILWKQVVMFFSLWILRLVLYGVLVRVVISVLVVGWLQVVFMDEIVVFMLLILVLMVFSSVIFVILVVVWQCRCRVMLQCFLILLISLKVVCGVRMLDMFLMVMELMLVFSSCLVRLSQVCRVCVGLVVYESVFWVWVLWWWIVCRVGCMLCGLFMVLKMWKMFMLFLMVCLMKCFIMLLVQWWQLSRFWLWSSICSGVLGIVFFSLCRWIYGFLLRKWMQVLKVVLFQYFSEWQLMLFS